MGEAKNPGLGHPQPPSECIRIKFRAAAGTVSGVIWRHLGDLLACARSQASGNGFSDHLVCSIHQADRLRPVGGPYRGHTRVFYICIAPAAISLHGVHLE